MRKGNIKNWEYNQSLEGLLFFAQRINEILFNYSLDTFKGRMLNSFLLCDEALNILSDVEEEKIDAHNIEYVIDELRWSLSLDIISKEILGDDKELFTTVTHDGQSWNSLRLQLELLSIKLNPNIYLDKCKELLYKAVKDKSKKDINNLTESLVTTLKAKGYSHGYIYNKAQTFFFNFQDIDKIDSVDKLKDFLNIFDGRLSNYDVYFFADKSIRPIIETNIIRGLSIFDYTNNLIETEEINSFISNKKDSDIILKYYAEQCLECNSARRRAYESTSQIIDIFSFFYHKERPIISGETLIVCQNEGPDKITILQTPTSPMKKGLDLRPSVAAVEFKDLLQNILFHGDSIAKMERAMDLHGICLENNNSGNQLLNIWTALEVLIPPDKKKSKVQQISDILSKSLSLGYCNRILKDLYQSFKVWDRRRFKHYIDQITENLDDYEKFIMLIVLDEYDALRKNIYSELDEYPLLRNRIFEVHKNLSKPKNVLSYIENHTQKIKWHIRRIYRTRNLLVHSDDNIYGLDILVENAHTYLDEFLRLFFRLAKGKNSFSIEQTVRYIELSYEHRLKLLRDTRQNLTKTSALNLLLWR